MIFSPFWGNLPASEIINGWNWGSTSPNYCGQSFNDDFGQHSLPAADLRMTLWHAKKPLVKIGCFRTLPMFNELDVFLAKNIWCPRNFRDLACPPVSCSLYTFSLIGDVYIYICMYVCMHACMHVCVYIFVCIYAYIFNIYIYTYLICIYIYIRIYLI